MRNSLGAGRSTEPLLFLTQDGAWVVFSTHVLCPCSQLEMFGVYKLDSMGILEDSSISGNANCMPTLTIC